VEKVLRMKQQQPVTRTNSFPFGFILASFSTRSDQTDALMRIAATESVVQPTV
jgi:hypothetical protein